MKQSQIGLQLYTLREYSAQDMRSVLEQVGAMGYAAVEPAGFGSLTASEMREACDQYALRVPAAHIGYADQLGRTEGVIADLQTLGATYAVVPFVGAEQRGSAEQVRAFAESLNTLGARFEPEGIQLVYHNHAFEFEPLDGTTMYDLLIEATDPALVMFELDIFWAEAGGVDPLALLRRLSGRVPLIHAKDMTELDGKTTDAPVGAGRLDWPALYAAAEAAGAEWYLVEQDHPRDAWNDVRESLAYLQQL